MTPTDISGHEITSGETWSGLIYLKGDIRVSEGGTLTIQPGTIVKVSDGIPDWDGGFESGDLDIYNRGNIIAKGTQDAVIVITVDSNYPQMDDWWGIGLSSSSSTELEYCCISYSDYGLFVFSTSPSSPAVENCMFAYSSGIVDFGPSSDIVNTTFINGNYGYARWTDHRTADISYCVFENNSRIDIRALDSFNEVTIENSNFIDNGYCNIQISSTFSPVGIEITADNCYGITTTDDNGRGTITEDNPSPTPIPDAGCGFDISDIQLKSTGIKSAKSAGRSIIDEEALIKYYNEKDKKSIR